MDSFAQAFEAIASSSGAYKCKTVEQMGAEHIGKAMVVNNDWYSRDLKHKWPELGKVQYLEF